MKTSSYFHTIMLLRNKSSGKTIKISMIMIISVCFHKSLFVEYKSFYAFFFVKNKQTKRKIRIIIKYELYKGMPLLRGKIKQQREVLCFVRSFSVKFVFWRDWEKLVSLNNNISLFCEFTASTVWGRYESNVFFSTLILLS